MSSPERPMKDDDILKLKGKRVKVTCTNGLTVEGHVTMEANSYDEAVVYYGRTGILDVKLSQIASIQILEGQEAPL